MYVVNNLGGLAEPIAAAAVKDYRRNMIQATDPGPGTQSRSPGTARRFTPEDDAHLRDALKRCSPTTREAACAFLRTGSLDYLPAIVQGLIEHYLERGARAKLSRSDAVLRLVEG